MIIQQVNTVYDILSTLYSELQVIIVSRVFDCNNLTPPQPASNNKYNPLIVIPQSVLAWSGLHY